MKINKKTAFIYIPITILIVFLMVFPKTSKIIGKFPGAISIVLIYVGMLAVESMEESPAEPVVEYGEFPFTLVYEVDGKVKKIEDTLICEYEGIDITMQGKRLKWKEYYLKNGDLLVIHKVSENEGIYYYPGSVYYFMGDKSAKRVSNEEKTFSAIAYNKETDSGHIYIRHSIDAKELYEKYRIKILSFECAQPIENLFIR